MLNLLTPKRTESYSTRSLEAQVGHTPLLHLKQTAVAANLPETVQIYAKAEWFNLSGSVKDRAALHIIRTAEENGQLWPGMTLLDASSGNMALAYAVLGKARGYKVLLAVPESAGAERIAHLRRLGAEVIVTPGADGSDGAIRAAQEIAKTNRSLFYANQYNNPANWQAYYETMAPEIWTQTQGQVTDFVAVLGSSGTFMGTARRLRAFNPDVRCIAVQPASAKEGIKGLKHMPTAIRPAIYHETVADAALSITRREADAMQEMLALCEGIEVGSSAAAAVAAAVNYARTLEYGHVVTVLPDAPQAF
ncbi:MAG: cysteine synthase family protein [Anaerolineae bacterium]|nr:cysteine synthase family protein [Anaerolineae bacterium]